MNLQFGWVIVWVSHLSSIQLLLRQLNAVGGLESYGSLYNVWWLMVTGTMIAKPTYRPSYMWLHSKAVSLETAKSHLACCDLVLEAMHVSSATPCQLITKTCLVIQGREIGATS